MAQMMAEEEDDEDLTSSQNNETSEENQKPVARADVIEVLSASPEDSPRESENAQVKESQQWENSQTKFTPSSSAHASPTPGNDFFR